MGKKEGCNKMNKKVHFVTAPFSATYKLSSTLFFRHDSRSAGYDDGSEFVFIHFI